jgi:outer membrane putative beta-barrel porin/alpha-amylase
VSARVPMVWIATAMAACCASQAASGAESVAPLEDNSFLLEEAYNQEARVVQHIFNWTRINPRGDYVLNFSQEWPLSGQRHQLAYSIPFESVSGSGHRGTGFGDVAIQYRYQWLGMDDTKLAAAPEVTLLLPTGDANEDLGAGATGGEVGLPLSLKLSDRFVAHTNVSFTYTGHSDQSPASYEYDLGQSLVWLAAARFNPMVEVVWSRSEPAGDAAGEREEGLLVSPGFRWAHDFPSGLQVCPGVAFPIGVGASSGDSGVLLYLSFEHGF